MNFSTASLVNRNSSKLSKKIKRTYMNTVIRTTLIILLLAAFPAGIRAQEDLHSASVFQKYGKQKGVTMVELSRDMLFFFPILNRRKRFSFSLPFFT